ncbi:hypothetical protein HF078_02290 [Bacillus sp. RO2]|uniref:hypothetical protein n=1 Tax=Bacillus sp. RO2 TaxID=2723913 RepID=UPI00145FC1D1|nr:hypothetical protein [Bacillus sp. RO2]NMH71895.1 hypothetical protein [Bacillus sp. RO2]
MKLFTYGFYGAGNAGDDAILEAVSVRSNIVLINICSKTVPYRKEGNFSEHPYLSSNH